MTDKFYEERIADNLLRDRDDGNPAAIQPERKPSSWGSRVGGNRKIVRKLETHSTVMLALLRLQRQKKNIRQQLLPNRESKLMSFTLKFIRTQPIFLYFVVVSISIRDLHQMTAFLARQLASCQEPEELVPASTADEGL